MNNYRIISEIGSGAYSTVHKAIDLNTGNVVAIKKISEENMNIKHIINREVAFLHKCLNHPNIIQLYKCFSVGSYTYLVFEYMPMDLISYYKSVQQSKKRNLKDEQICFISYQIFNAIHFLHGKGIMHRDIKPENILIDPDCLTVKLIDFGFAKTNDTSNNTNYMVTRWYRPLEIVLNLSYNQKVDVFAAGALILQLYLGTQIFRSSSNLDQFFWITNICGFPSSKWTKAHDAIYKLGLKNQLKPPELRQYLKPVKPIASDLITKMLKTSPQQRISMAEVINHPYFSRFKIKNIDLFNKYNHLPHKLIDTASKDDNFRNNSLKKNKAFSTQHFHRHSNSLFFNHQIKKTESFQDSTLKQIDPKSQQVETAKNQQNKLKKSNQDTTNPKKYFIKRISTEKKNYSTLRPQTIISKQLLANVNSKFKPQERLRNRVKSMNAIGINVVSMKKLKVLRQIQKQRLKAKRQESLSKQQKRKNSQLQTIKLNPRKDKPMFLRVKQKINEGRINQRGQERPQFIEKSLSRNTSVSQISTKIYSTAQRKVGKLFASNQYNLQR